MNPLAPVTVCCFKGVPGRYRDDPPPPDDEGPRRPNYPPLTRREKVVYSVFAGWGCLTFLLLLLIVIITHSPIIAN